MRYVIMGLGIALGFTGAALAADITPAPAFTPEDLSQRPTENWITNGGTLTNQRYSPLDQINRDTVKDLKALWRTGMGSGAAPGNSGQAQILVYEGTLYVSNGDNDVFAMDVDSGEILWSHKGNPDPRAGSPFGRSNRGVAMGEGMIFASQLDGKIVALDQKTGEPVWSVQGAPWEKGYSITSAPLYYDGMVITGYSGGVMGRRCYIDALDAKTGELIWRFYTIPGPGEFGHDTWPQDGDAWQHGGAPVWNTPAVDPELGLIYFATGNTGPVLNGAVREGDNLFANSIVALDVKTGEYRWHFQEVHHDIWDYDATNPVILFDAEYKGKTHKALAQAGKTGWVYILDRETGEPLIGIEEKPVPQEPRQKTAATQPYPIGDPFVPHEIDIVPEEARLEPGTTELPNKGRIFTPFWTEEVTLKPNPQGGANWPPSSYDPETHYMYICGTDRTATYKLTLPLEPPVDNVPYFGGGMGQAKADDRGVFVAMDLTTNRIAWRQQWREACYSGSVLTAGGLIFVGRSDGRLTALDKTNGALLWQFQTDAGVNTTVTTFMHEGDQRVVVHAGGGVFANGKRGDGIWMFSLKGTMESLDPSVMAAQPATQARPPRLPDREPDHAAGQTLYKEACLPCHGPTGAGGEGGGAAFTDALTIQSIMSVVQTGRERMPAFGDTYSTEELYDLSHYIRDVLVKADE